MQVDGVLCDMDGTLLDSEHLHLEAWNRIIEMGGHTPDPRWNDDCIGLPDTFARDKVLRLYPDMAAFGDIHAKKQDVFLEMVVARAKELVFPGVPEKLRELAAAGCKLAVCTNSLLRNTRPILTAAGLIDWFATIVTLDLVPNGKPAPDIYQTAAEELGLDPAVCLVVEDSAAGIAAGKSAGCTVVGVTTTWTQDKLPGADRYCPDTATALALALDGKAHHAGNH